MVDRVCKEPSTLSFAVDLARATSATRELATAVGSRARVESVVGRRYFDTEVFMRVRATPAQTAAVRADLDRDPDVLRVTFVSHADAYRAFKRLFAGQHQLIQQESPAGLPESFQLVLREGASRSDVAARYEAKPGVDQVIRQPTSGVTLAEACAVRKQFGDV